MKGINKLSFAIILACIIVLIFAIRLNISEKKERKLIEEKLKTYMPRIEEKQVIPKSEEEQLSPESEKQEAQPSQEEKKEIIPETETQSTEEDVLIF